MAESERYEIQGKIGEGGLGSIYRAYDRQLSRTVALKRINPGPDADPQEAFEAILSESRALSAVNSTHIVSVFDIDQDDDGPYVVMEFLEGETLEDLVTRAPFVETDFVTAAGQMLEGLIAAHQRKIIHRDIKPSNLMFTWLPSGRFQVKILDFGLAKFSAEPAPQSKGNGKALMGSIFFMAPEQFANKPVDVRTDLYSLGCVLYYSITAQHPFEGDSATEVMAGHITGNAPPLEGIRPDFNPALLRWIEQLMARVPDERFPDAQSALNALEEIKPAPETGTGPVAVARPVLKTGPIPTVAVAAPPEEAPEPSPPQHPLTVTLPTTGLPVWLLITAGSLAGIILLLALIALLSGDKEPAPDPKADSPTTTPPAPEKTLEPTKEYRRFLLARDTNQNKQLEISEFTQPGPVDVRNEFLERLAALDTNNNAILEFSELHTPATTKAFAQLVVEIDTDQSGELSLKELGTYVRAKTGGSGASARFTELDLDRSNTLTAAELEFGRLLPWIWQALP